MTREIRLCSCLLVLSGACAARRTNPLGYIALGDVSERQHGALIGLDTTASEVELRLQGTVTDWVNESCASDPPVEETPVAVVKVTASCWEPGSDGLSGSVATGVAVQVNLCGDSSYSSHAKVAVYRKPWDFSGLECVSGSAEIRFVNLWKRDFRFQSQLPPEGGEEPIPTQSELKEELSREAEDGVE